MKKLTLLATLAILFSVLSFNAKAQLYWNTNGTPATWTSSNWGTSSSGPFNNSWTANSNTYFTANSQVTFATTNIGDITLDNGITVTFTTGGTLGTNGTIRTIDVGTGSSLVFSSQAISTASGTGFIKTGSGTWNIGAQVNNYDGGFTLSSGIVNVSGYKSFGNSSLLINGGEIYSTGSHNYNVSSISIGGNFTLSGSGNDVWSSGVSLGSSTRTITNSTSSGGSRTFSGIISGSTGTGLTFTGSGASPIILEGANTYDGLTTVSGGTVKLNRSGGNALPSTNSVTINGGTLQISTNQTLDDLTLTSGTLIVDNGVTLTINGTFSINSSATITLNGSIQYGGSGVLSYTGASNQTSTDNEWPSTSGPSSVTIGSSGVSIHASRTLTGTLTLNGKLSLGSSNLILGNSATISGFGSSNYIVTNGSGYLQRNNISATSTDFPVGPSASNYNPVILSNSGTADNYRVRVANDVLANGTSGSALTADVVNKTWTVEEETGGGSNVSLTVQWVGGDELSSFTRSSCYLAHYTSGAWSPASAAAASGSDPYTISRSGITTFSPFGVGSGGILPVKLINFKAVRKGNGVQLNWTTTSEINNDYFSIERETIEGHFDRIGTVKGAGNTSVNRYYSFTDNNPIASTSKYYRIIQYDFDGKNEVFGPVLAKFNTPDVNLLVTPNPFTDVLKLVYCSETDIQIKVFNTFGTLVYQDVLRKECKSELLKTENWEPGTYFITVLGSNFFKNLRYSKLQ
jgi:autotransporter-associated beta strand protein